MRLNMDCIRDILLCIEDLVTPTRLARFLDIDLLNATAQIFDDELPKTPPYQEKLLEKYTNEEIIYHLQYCLKDNLIELHTNSMSSDILVKDLTPKGHEFLANIRYNTVYEKTKQICKKLGVQSLSSFVQIAQNVTSEIIKSYFISS
ncbi:DUF2513 domain-containing protein [Megamonas sp.]